MENIENADSKSLTDRILNLVANLSDERKQILLDTLVEWQQKEQRNDSRMSCLLAVDFATQKRAYRDFMQDLSKGGVYIETREPINVGETISLTFATSNPQSNFKMSGKIVRSDNKGIGVEFNNKLSIYQEQIIKSAVKR